MVVQTERFNYMHDRAPTSQIKFDIVKRIQAAEESDKQAMTSPYAVSLKSSESVKKNIKKELQEKYDITFTDDVYQEWRKEYQLFQQRTFSWERVPLVGRLVRWYKTIPDDTITTFGSGLGGFLTGAAGGGAIANYIIIPGAITIAAAAGVSLTIPGVGVMAIIGISALIVGFAATIISIKIAHYAKKRQNDHIANIIGAVQQEQERVEDLQSENDELKQELKTLQAQLVTTLQTQLDATNKRTDNIKQPYTPHSPNSSRSTYRLFPNPQNRNYKEEKDIAGDFKLEYSSHYSSSAGE